MRLATLVAFLKSRVGSGFLSYLVVCAVIASGTGVGFYTIGLERFEAAKSEEKITALKLVDGFVNTYSELLPELNAPNAPIPAEFRAHSIARFNEARENSDQLQLRWVGRQGRQIATPPDDAAEAIESFVPADARKSRSAFVPTRNGLVFRTLYPSVAGQQSCVDCHNRHQPGLDWRLNDLMGAFVIDVPAEPFLAKLKTQSIEAGLLLFSVLCGIGIVIFGLHWRQITEREAIRRQLVRNEGRLRDFAESSSDWFWEQDQDLRLAYVSQSPLGGGADASRAASTRGIFDMAGLVGTEDRLLAYERDLKARLPFQGIRMQREDAAGHAQHVEISGRPYFDEHGLFQGYRGTGRDVTAEVNYELELTRKVEERTAALRDAQNELVKNERLLAFGQLIGTVASEMRNPLSAIRNTVFVIREMTKDLPLALERPISRIEHSIEKCNRIIFDLLDFTRTRAVRLGGPVAFDRWVEETMADQLVPDGISVETVLSCSDKSVHIDGERFRRVVVNVLENAFQALAETSGEKRISIATRVADGNVVMEIRDNGPGIDSDNLPRVFEPLFSTRALGTGLGLATVRQIVEQHDGLVEIDSEPGKGTIVRIDVPIALSCDIAAAA